MALKYCQYSSVTLSYLGFLFLVCNSRVDGSTLKLLSVTRSANSGDSFELHSHNDSVCDISSCGQYGGLLRREESGKRTTGKCSCYCNSAVKPTFYSTKLGQQGCVKDVEVLKDSNGDICDFYTADAQQLEVLNLQAGGKRKIKPNGFCEQVQISGWKFYYNASWILSLYDTFSVISGGNGNGFGKGTFSISWDGNLKPFYKGLLIKVMVRCTFRGKIDDRCVMLKAKGTHVYHELPPIYEEPLPTTIPRKRNKKAQSKTKALKESTDSIPPPTGSYPKASTRQIWITVCLSLSGVVFIAVIVIAGCLASKCRRNCRKRERTGSRHHLAVESSQSRSDDCPALHDYEYVHYPCLVDGRRTPPVTPIGNIKYERGEDNKLIIWSPGVTTPPNSQSAEAAAPRLPYQRLLTRTTSSPPACDAGIRPTSSTTAETASPYQKLVRSASAAPCRRGKDSTAVVIEDHESDETQRAYQSLSLKRNPQFCPKESDSGYMRMEGIPVPQSTTDYEYADPIELNKNFRISSSESEHTTSEISIGDLGDATTIQQIQQQQQRHGNCVRVQDSVSYENIENSYMENSSIAAITSDNGLKADGVSPAASYEDVPEGCLGDLSRMRLDPEEYVEMGKRRSVLIMEDSGPSGCHGFDKIEEEDPEYYILEGTETCEGNTEGNP